MKLNDLQQNYLRDYFIKHPNPSPHQYNKLSKLLSIDKRTMYITFIQFKTELRYSHILPSFLFQ